MGNIYGSKKEDGKEDENGLFIKYDVDVEKSLASYNEHTDDNNIPPGNQVRITIWTRNGWKELTGYVFKKSEIKDSSENKKYKYFGVPNLKLLEGLSHSQRASPVQQGDSHSLHAKPTKRRCSEPIHTEESPKHILDITWTKELRNYQTIKLLPVGNCVPLCDEIKKILPSCTFVDEGGQVTVIVTVKTTRIQSDAEMAIEHANIGSDDRNKYILMMFHSIAGSKTIEDINNVMYNNPSVYKTFHVPFKRNW